MSKLEQNQEFFHSSKDEKIAKLRGPNTLFKVGGLGYNPAKLGLN